MPENNLLNYPYNNRKQTMVINTIVKVNNTNQVWEFDIKYIYVQGESRNTYLLAIIDCYTREVVGHYLGCHCTGNDVKNTMINAFDKRGINNISGIKMRSDNGTQFICNIVEAFLSMMNIYHERIHPATPENDILNRSIQSLKGK
ncbi:DDE-type integrase/transposase/recombinase [Acidiplasma aeolicum]|uniref:Integrase catalytic domain-containing protein n=1 Tax=Acidiplasma aeolicum TaxID=507754 RepID=A0A0Q1B530_9ARCH|nr:DDE-type integrase/transposase/recombinase [Acidiplasma aeolicum]KQB35121.1 hypothetical protein AOG54_09220 [Acidiplasma aeolicum]